MVSNIQKCLILLSNFCKSECVLSTPVVSVPEIVLKDGQVVTGLSTVAKYIVQHSSKVELLGSTLETAAQIDDWLSWCTTELEPLTDAKLAQVNEHLLSRTYLVDCRLTLADIVVYGVVSPAVTSFPVAQAAHFVSLLRWYDLLHNSIDTEALLPPVKLAKPLFEAPTFVPPAAKAPSAPAKPEGAKSSTQAPKPEAVPAAAAKPEGAKSSTQAPKPEAVPAAAAKPEEAKSSTQAPKPEAVPAAAAKPEGAKSSTQAPKPEAVPAAAAKPEGAQSSPPPPPPPAKAEATQSSNQATSSAVSMPIVEKGHKVQAAKVEKAVAASAAATAALAAPMNTLVTAALTPGKKEKEKKAESKPEKSGGKGEGKAASKEEDEVRIDMLDIRVGVITKVEKHPNADTLYLEQIDVGEAEPRQVISGLVKFVPIEEMRNRRLLVVCNLKPAKMRDIMSYGMVLCASDDSKERVVPLTVPEGVPIGERVTCTGYSQPALEQVNPKKQILERLFPDMKTDAEGKAVFKGAVFETSKGPVTSTIPNGWVK